MTNNMKIGLIYTTFMRPALVKETLPTVLKYTNNDVKIFVADQGLASDGISAICEELGSDRIKYYQLPYDCGLSYARNYLVKEIDKENIKNVVVSADSIYFDNYLTFVQIIDFLWYNKSRGIIGMKLRDRISWERDMELVDGKWFNLTLPKRESFIENDIKYIQCDIIKNFFVAKTECLLDVQWDEKLKVAEHEDYFYRLSQTHWGVYFTNYLKACYKDFKPSAYNAKRKRMYGEYRKMLQEKYKISSWVKYEKGDALCD